MTDLSPVLVKIQTGTETNGIDLQEMKDTFTGIEESLVGKVEATIKQAIAETESVSTFRTAAKPRRTPKVEAAVDISNIAL